MKGKGLIKDVTNLFIYRKFIIEAPRNILYTILWDLTKLNYFQDFYGFFLFGEEAIAILAKASKS